MQTPRSTSSCAWRLSPPPWRGGIIQREPKGWSGLPRLLEHARELAASTPGLPGVDLVLTTQGERPEAVAERIRAALRARHALPRR